LEEVAGCPWQKEKVIFGTAGLKFHVCRKELAAPGRMKGSSCEKEKVMFSSAD
jgi:hypothetical protein